MTRVVLHADRREHLIKGSFFVLVIDGVPCASGERESMIDLLDYISGEIEKT